MASPPSPSPPSQPHPQPQEEEERPNAAPDPETSAESAALARGASRTAATASRGAMAGRLPLSSASASSKTAASKALATRPPPRVIARSSRGPIRIPKARTPPSSTSTVGASARARPPGGNAPRARPRASASSRRLAEASDRASKSWDVLSAGQDVQWQSEGPSRENFEGKSNGNSKVHAKGAEKWNWKLAIPSLSQMASFGKTFVTNTVLGMAVFSTYEGMIDWLAPKNATTTPHDIPDDGPGSAMGSGNSDAIAIRSVETKQWHGTEEENDDAMDRASISQHVFAGGLGGMAHALLSMALEMKVNPHATTTMSSASAMSTDVSANYHEKNGNHRVFAMKAPNSALQTSISIRYPTLPYASSSILHHSVAHSVLFGSYQFTKRFLLRQYSLSTFDADDHDFSASSSSSSPDPRENILAHASIIAVAGGLAGQFQHVTSHFTEQWLRLGEADTPTSHPNPHARATTTMTMTMTTTMDRRWRMVIPSWPSWRSTA
ncbi:hypothetical protein ACHAXS_006528, partial [Conticribra weissflogii]